MHFSRSCDRNDTKSPVACIRSKKKLKSVGWEQRTYIDDFHLEMQTKVAIHGHLVRSTTCNGPIRCQRRSERFRDENRFLLTSTSARKELLEDRPGKASKNRNTIRLLECDSLRALIFSFSTNSIGPFLSMRLVGPVASSQRECVNLSQSVLQLLT
ncbi:LOW QUALITY PROTEIN: hypothetical protein V1477_015273 [Vespula maculifrons]|uniref:Uncharacterized protein n=1 Tax=Vespula maculifrons TaxID=7453 RepID=A0ABD2BJT5_VESMC